MSNVVDINVTRREYQNIEDIVADAKKLDPKSFLLIVEAAEGMVLFAGPNLSLSATVFMTEKAKLMALLSK